MAEHVTTGDGDTVPTRSPLAVASLVCGLLWLFWVGSIMAVIFGHIALHRIHNDPTIEGKGLATAGVILGWAAIVLPILLILLLFLLLVPGDCCGSTRAGHVVVSVRRS